MVSSPNRVRAQRARASRRSGGFTLIEVMVAVAILALSLTAIFSSEAGAAKAAHRSRKLGLATLAARCKMNEIEEQVASEGLPAVFDSGSDECCRDAPLEGIDCTWEIDPIVLPDTMFAPEEPGGNEPGKDAKPTDPSAKPTAPGAPAAKDPMQAVQNIDPAEVLAGGGMGGMAAMALGYAYPVLKPGFEAQIRRATVTVHWHEGNSEHSFDVTQYLVADKPAGQDPNSLNQAGQQPLPGAQGQAGPGSSGLPAFGTPQTSRSQGTF